MQWEARGSHVPTHCRVDHHIRLHRALDLFVRGNRVSSLAPLTTHEHASNNGTTIALLWLAKLQNRPSRCKNVEADVLSHRTGTIVARKCLIVLLGDPCNNANP